MTPELDTPEREESLRRLILRKKALKAFYDEQYRKYADVLSRSPREGMVLELGSGAGFVKEVLPEITTSDVIRYRGVDAILNAAKLPFPDQSLRAVFLSNVLHHLPDAEGVFRELSRCLMISGRVLIVDQYAGYPARWIYKYLHHEPYHPESMEWKFAAGGPLSSANGALAWMIFVRDRVRFQNAFPALQIQAVRPHSPFRYWLCGGLKSWSLLPGSLFAAATVLDRALIRVSPAFASFMDVELCRVESAA